MQLLQCRQQEKQGLSPANPSLGRSQSQGPLCQSAFLLVDLSSMGRDLNALPLA